MRIEHNAAKENHELVFIEIIIKGEQYKIYKNIINILIIQLLVYFL